jgi:hypothetical protein
MGVEFADSESDFELSAECLAHLKTNATGWDEAPVEVDPVTFIKEQFEIISSYHGVPIVDCIKAFLAWLKS